MNEPSRSRFQKCRGRRVADFAARALAHGSRLQRDADALIEPPPSAEAELLAPASCADTPPPNPASALERRLLDAIWLWAPDWLWAPIWLRGAAWLCDVVALRGEA